MKLSQALNLNEYIYGKKESGATYQEIANELNMTVEAVRSRYRRFRDSVVEASSASVVFERESEPIEFSDWRTSFDRMKVIQEEYEDRDVFDNQMSLTLDCTKAIVVVTGDWHIGLKSVDYEKLQKDIDSWLRNDVFVIINGDIIELGMGSQGIGSATEQLVSPELQHLIAKDIVNQLANAELLLMATSGNHESRAGRVLFETIRFIYEDVLKKDVKLFGNKGILNIEIDENWYNIFVGHQMPGATESNPFGAHMKVLKNYSDLDVVSIAHTHTYNYATFFNQGKYVHLMTGGTYSDSEEYAVRYFNPIGSKINHYLGLSRDGVKHFETLQEALLWKNYM